MDFLIGCSEGSSIVLAPFEIESAVRAVVTIECFHGIYVHKIGFVLPKFEVRGSWRLEGKKATRSMRINGAGAGHRMALFNRIKRE